MDVQEEGRGRNQAYHICSSIPKRHEVRMAKGCCVLLDIGFPATFRSLMPADLLLVKEEPIPHHTWISLCTTPFLESLVSGSGNLQTYTKLLLDVKSAATGRTNIHDSFQSEG
jgi:hypothetical protein